MEFTKEEIFNLTEKGFTPDQIMLLVSGTKADTSPDSIPVDPDSPATPPEGATNPGEMPKESVNLNATVAELTKTVGELGNTVKALQTANINGAKGGKANNIEDTIKEHIESFTKEF